MDDDSSGFIGGFIVSDLIGYVVNDDDEFIERILVNDLIEFRDDDEDGFLAGFSVGDLVGCFVGSSVE